MKTAAGWGCACERRINIESANNVIGGIEDERLRSQTLLRIDRSGLKYRSICSRLAHLFDAKAELVRLLSRNWGEALRRTYRHNNPTPANDMQHTMASVRHFACNAIPPSIVAMPTAMRHMATKCLDIPASFPE
jgi:hypothetical protein